MFARRVVTRRLGGSQLQRQFIHPSISQLQALPRPNTWLAKIRFRADGKSRSKLIALGFGSLILCNLLSLHTLIDTINDGNKTEKNLARLIYVQLTDLTYDSVDFDDPMSIVSYFSKLYCARHSDEVDAIIRSLIIRIYEKETKDGSTKYPGLRALHIMRSAAMMIHGALRELEWDSIAITAELVKLMLSEALESLLDLDCDDDDDDSPQMRLPFGSWSLGNRKG